MAADHRPEPIFPRWSAYYQVWVGVLLLPASLIIFFNRAVRLDRHRRVRIAAAVFGTWYLIMTKLLLTAVRREADEDRELAGSPEAV